MISKCILQVLYNVGCLSSHTWHFIRTSSVGRITGSGRSSFAVSRIHLPIDGLPLGAPPGNHGFLSVTRPFGCLQKEWSATGVWVSYIHKRILSVGNGKEIMFGSRTVQRCTVPYFLRAEASRFLFRACGQETLKRAPDPPHPGTWRCSCVHRESSHSWGQTLQTGE